MDKNAITLALQSIIAQVPDESTDLIADDIETLYQELELTA